MNYDTWKATDTLGDEQDGIARAEQRAAEDAREEHWRTFVDWCKGDRPKSDSEFSTLLYHIYQNMRGSADWHYKTINDTILNFAALEGWPGVLNALARAMREQSA